MASDPQNPFRNSARPQMPQAPILTSASPGPGAGTAISSSRTLRGPWTRAESIVSGNPAGAFIGRSSPSCRLASPVWHRAKHAQSISATRAFCMPRTTWPGRSAVGWSSRRMTCPLTTVARYPLAVWSSLRPPPGRSWRTTGA